MDVRGVWTDVRVDDSVYRYADAHFFPPWHARTLMLARGLGSSEATMRPRRARDHAAHADFPGDGALGSTLRLKGRLIELRHQDRMCAGSLSHSLSLSLSLSPSLSWGP